MKKSIVALLAASAVVALTGAGASAVGDFTLKAKNDVVAGSSMTIGVSHAKAGCDVNLKVKDQTNEALNTPYSDGTDWWNYDYTDNTVATGNVKLGTKTSGSTSIKAPAKAGTYELTGIVKLTKLSCVPVAGTTVYQYFNVGQAVYIDEVEGRRVSAADRVLGTYNYELNGSIRTWTNGNLKAGVGVELWVTNIDESRWVRIKTTKTNAFGEFKFAGVYNKNAHYDYDFQVRVVRDAKYFEPYDWEGYGVYSSDFYGFFDTDGSF